MSEDQPAVKRYRREEEKQEKDFEEEDDYVPYVSVKERRKQKLAKLGRITEIKEETKTLPTLENSSGNSSEVSELDEDSILATSQETSLLLQHSKLKKLAEAKQESEREKRKKEEEILLQSVKENTALMGAAELAKGVQYVDPIKTSWKPPKIIQAQPNEYHEAYVRFIFHFDQKYG